MVRGSMKGVTSADRVRVPTLTPEKSNDYVV